MDAWQTARLATEALRNPSVAFDSSLYDDDGVLFRVAVTSSVLWAAASHKLAAECPEPHYEEVAIGYGEGGPRVPPELILSLVHHLGLGGLCALGGTCKGFRRECTVILEDHFRRRFAAFGLSWASFRFMLTETDAIVSGTFTFELLRVNDGRARGGNAMDVYVRDGAPVRLLQQYLAVATGYKQHSTHNHSNLGVAQDRVFRRAQSSSQIRVHVCEEDPRQTVMRGLTTAQFSWMSGKGVFVAYPHLTFNWTALTSPTRFPLQTLQHSQSLRRVGAHHKAHGFTILPFHHDRVGPSRSGRDCDRSRTCPSAFRTSADKASFHHIFSNTGWDRNPDRQLLRFDVGWILGAMDCAPERSMLGFVVRTQSLQSRSQADAVYVARMAQALQGI